jgi:hypothetical protein
MNETAGSSALPLCQPPNPDLTPPKFSARLGSDAECRAGAGEVLFVHRRCRAVCRYNLARTTACRCDLRQPKIQNLGVPSLGDENVRGLDVSVDDTCDVCGIERVGDVDSDGEKDFDFQRATCDSMFQYQPV